MEDRGWPREMMMPALTAAAVIVLIGFHSGGPAALRWCLLPLLLLPAWEDARSGYMSDLWSVVIAAAGVARAAMSGHLPSAAGSLLLVGAVYGILYFFFRNGVGTGDIFLSLAVSVWLAPLAAAFFIWLSAAAASLAGVIFVAAGKKSWSDGLRFGPFIALGGGAAYVWQECFGASLSAAARLFGL